MTPLLRIENLEKSFGENRALRGVSFNLAAAERLALLGPNGAGKTTLIRCLSGRCRPSGGSVRIDGADINGREVRSAIGLVPQDIAVYGDLTVRENLMAFGRFHGLTRSHLIEQVNWAIQWTGLADRAGELVGGFSGGMKRRVNLACGVLHRPRILLLDEPTVGVDPQSRHKIFEMLDDLSAGGTAIVLTTHHLDEAESRCDRIVIMDHGNVVADGTIDTLVRSTVGPARMVRFRIDRPLRQPIPIPRLRPADNLAGGLATGGRATGGRATGVDAAGTCLQSADIDVDAGDEIAFDSGFEMLGVTGETSLSTRIDQVSTQLPVLLDRVRRGGYDVRDVEVHAPSLHHVFLHLTGHGLRDG